MNKATQSIGEYISNNVINLPITNEVTKVSHKQQLTFNKSYKQEIGSLGFIRKNLIKFNSELPTSEQMDVIMLDLLTKMAISSNYNYVKENIKANKQGLYSVHALTMYLKKNVTQLQNTFAQNSLNKVA
jgi:hypothetical protein